MTGKLRRTAVILTALLGTYLGLLVVFWIVLNFRLFTAPLNGFGEILGYIVLLFFFVILLSNLVPAAVLKRLRVARLWPYLMVGVPTAVLFVFAFTVLVDIEFTLGMILPKGPGGVNVPTLMVVSPTDLVHRLADMLPTQLPADKRAQAAMFITVVSIPFMIGSGLYWLFAVRRAAKRAAG
jgi:hypothetical protein